MQCCLVMDAVFLVKDVSVCSERSRNKVPKKVVSQAFALRGSGPRFRQNLWQCDG